MLPTAPNFVTTLPEVHPEIGKFLESSVTKDKMKVSTTPAIAGLL